MSRKGKIKGWCREHKLEIYYVTAIGMGALIGAHLGSKITSNPGKLYYIPQGPMKWVIDDIGKAKMDVFGGITTDGCTPDELGELGKLMVEYGAPADKRFTHFIAIAKHN